MPMTAQNAAHGCDCGKVKVTLLNKRNAAEALTAPLNGKTIAIDDIADLIYINIQKLLDFLYTTRTNTFYEIIRSIAEQRKCYQ